VNAIRWKFTVACAIFAFVVSSTIALIAGNPFGGSIIRAILAAVLFGGAGTAVQILVAVYLPELDQLFSSASSSIRDDSDDELEHSVDIVVEGDDMESDQFSDDDSDDGRYTELNADGESGSDDALEELASDDLVEEAADTRSGSAVASQDPADSVEPGSVDSLPDVGGFSDAFDAPESISSSAASGGKSRSGDHDPEMMAKALQTMLKRDT
jgi:hypothetical protein